jgi:pyruvate,water dikinase
LQRIDTLYQFNVKVAYQNIVIPLLMSVYGALLKSRLKRLGVDFVHFDLMNGDDEIKRYDPNVSLDQLKNTFENLPASVKEKISASKLADLENSSGAEEFGQDIHQFIQRFGHLSDSGNDFSRIPWREDRDRVLNMIINHHPGERDHQKVTWKTLQAPSLSKFVIAPIFQRARRSRLRREQVSSLYTSSYGWFRVYFLVLAKQLVQQGSLREENDIFYLTLEEVRTLVAEPETSVTERIKNRKDEIEQSQDAVLPEIIYGSVPPPLSLLKDSMDKLKGTATSSGYFEGPLKVVHSAADFDKVKRGDVIAIPYSDVAWTPLFARAGAVVAESGGILSHSSIVAREYGIPCVVSVSGACNLPEGSRVIVDGFQGTIHIVREQ